MLTAPQLLGYYPDLQDSADQDRARARPLALLHQHVPELGARAPVPHNRPQRRDQHAARQRQLDAGARVAARLRAVRRGDLAKVLPDRPPRRLGLGDVRQRARAARAAGPPAAARGDDDDPGGVRGPRRPARAPQGLLRLPLLPDGAVGRPRRGRVHRRPRDRRDARPQRPAPRPLAGDQGRLGRARLGDRRDGRAGRQHRPQGPPAARQALPRRPRAEGRIVADEEVKRDVATQQPYGDWYREGIVHLADLPDARAAPSRAPSRCALRQLAFGYTQEDLRVLLGPTAAGAAEPIGSMGNDLALAVLSDRQPPLFSYFKQLFAQVTNPPIDPIRESIVMSVATGVGSERNLLDETPEHAHQLSMDTPILRYARAREAAPGRLVDLRARTRSTSRGRSATGPTGWPAPSSASAPRPTESLADGVNILILSDRDVGAERVPIPSLLAVAAVHHHLVREGTRLQAGLVLESGEPREVHHFATLIGYGASAINPYLMFESLAELVEDGRLPEGMDVDEAEDRVVKGIAKGLLKTISKMGISTIQSYTGAQIFEAVGLAPELIDAPLPRHRVADRRHRHRRARARDARPPRPRLPAHARGPAAGRRHLRVAPRGRAPHVEPGDDRAAPARGPPRRGRDLRGVLEADQRGRRPPRDAARAAARSSSCPRTSGCRSTRSSRPRRSSSASRPARCRSARSRARRTRRWRSR